MVPFLLKTGFNCMKYFIRSIKLNNRSWNRNICRKYGYVTRPPLSFIIRECPSARIIKSNDNSKIVYIDAGYRCSSSTPDTHPPVPCFRNSSFASSHHHLYIAVMKYVDHSEIVDANGSFTTSCRGLTEGGPPAP